MHFDWLVLSEKIKKRRLESFQLLNMSDSVNLMANKMFDFLVLLQVSVSVNLTWQYKNSQNYIIPLHSLQ